MPDEPFDPMECDLCGKTIATGESAMFIESGYVEEDSVYGPFVAGQESYQTCEDCSSKIATVMDTIRLESRR